MIDKLLLALAAGLVAAELTKEQQAAIIKPVEGVFSGFSGFGFVADDFQGEISATPDVVGTWLPPAAALPYLDLLHDAERENGMPENLLVRVAYQESRFRDDIITGKTVSSAGALGIMQIVPRWHPNVDPLNVPEAINYAGAYLARLRRITGSWAMALAAYNWGIGNLNNKGFDKAPTETKNYVSQIANDVAGVYA